MHESDDREPMQVQVECDAASGEPIPVRFSMGDRVMQVLEVLDRWLEAEHRYFKVRPPEGGVYILRHDVESGVWDIVVYDSGALRETRLSST